MYKLNSLPELYKYIISLFNFENKIKLFFYMNVALECSQLIIEQTPRSSWEFLVLQYKYDVIYVDLTVMFQSSV